MFVLTSDKNRHIIDAAIALKDASSSRLTAPRRVFMAADRASNAVEIGAGPWLPLERIEVPKALMAGERNQSCDVPSSDGRTSIHAQHIEERDVVGELEKWQSSLAGTKFWTHNETTSRRVQLSKRVTVVGGTGLLRDAAWLPPPRSAVEDGCLLVLGLRRTENRGGRKIQSAGYPGHWRPLTRH